MKYTVTVLSLALLSPLTLAAPTTAPTTAPAPKPLTENQIIANELADADPAVQQKAWEKVQALMAAPPELDPQGRPKVQIDTSWPRSLIRAKKYDEAEQLAIAGISKRPFDGPAVAAFAKARVSAFMVQKKFDAALAAGKSTFNVCSINDTAAADQIVGPLLKVRPDAKAAVDGLKAQNAKDATVEPKNDLLKTITVDAKPCESLAASLKAEDYAGLLARGNVLLLCDKPGEAKASFEAALNQANTEREAMTAFDGVARAIRAETGGIAPANAWLADRMKDKPKE